MAKQLRPRSSMGAAKSAGFNDRRAAVTNTETTQQEAPVTEVVNTPITEPPQPIKTNKPKAVKKYKAIISGRVTNIERTATHLKIPNELLEKIDQNISGSKIAIYIALLEEGYRSIMEQSQENGGLAHLDIEEILESYRDEIE